VIAVRKEPAASDATNIDVTSVTATTPKIAVAVLIATKLQKIVIDAVSATTMTANMQTGVAKHLKLNRRK
jgi:hypothetical protein